MAKLSHNRLLVAVGKIWTGTSVYISSLASYDIKYSLKFLFFLPPFIKLGPRLYILHWKCTKIPINDQNELLKRSPKCPDFMAPVYKVSKQASNFSCYTYLLVMSWIWWSWQVQRIWIMWETLYIFLPSHSSHNFFFQWASENTHLLWENAVCIKMRVPSAFPNY
jgi:hypothetical protein